MTGLSANSRRGGVMMSTTVDRTTTTERRDPIQRNRRVSTSGSPTVPCSRQTRLGLVLRSGSLLTRRDSED